MSKQGAWEQVEVLAEPTRRRGVDAVRAARGPVTREQIAHSVGVARELAAFHLDRLADAGLVHVSYARPEGRTGPGAGRPAKQYDATGVSVAMQVPPRRDVLVGQLLARAVAADSDDAAELARTLAHDEGMRLGTRQRPARSAKRTSLRSVAATLADLGYEPTATRSEVRLQNCPFHDVMAAAPELVCGMNVELIAGLLYGVGAAPDLVAEFSPTPGQCCVVVRRAANS